MRVNEVTSEKPVGNFPEMQHILQIASAAVACSERGRAAPRYYRHSIKTKAEGTAAILCAFNFGQRPTTEWIRHDHVSALGGRPEFARTFAT